MIKNKLWTKVILKHIWKYKKIVEKLQAWTFIFFKNVYFSKAFSDNCMSQDGNYIAKVGYSIDEDNNYGKYWIL